MHLGTCSLAMSMIVLLVGSGCATTKSVEPAPQDASKQEAQKQEARMQHMRKRLAKEQEEDDRLKRTEEFMHRSDPR